MKVARNPQTRLRTWFAPHHRGRKSRQRLAQAEPAVETVRRFGQVAPRILGLFDGMVGATDRPLEVAQDDVDPSRSSHFGGGAAAAGVERCVGVAGVFEPAEASQAVTVDLALRCQAARDPVVERGVVEAADRLDHCEGRAFEVFVRLHCDHERLLVLRSAPGLSAVALAAQIGVVKLHETLEFSGILPLGHGLHDLVLQAPGGLVVHAQVAHQFQRSQIGLGRGQQVHRQHPGAQRQFGAFEQGARRQGRLMPASAALVVDRIAAPESRTRASGTGQAAVAFRPAPLVQGPVTLCFGAVAVDELAHR